uniref:Uncharacterized protein n=1 Tax=Oryza sativa subsp. japonica TaxID=39947 RepID=Q67UK1_ORYSJ|nr:hypothetical protein [Oryza sativa Japonica Group]BAD38168.1 hypothetical protein [Oryza sativa Japonica Group]
MSADGQVGGGASERGGLSELRRRRLGMCCGVHLRQDAPLEAVNGGGRRTMTIATDAQIRQLSRGRPWPAAGGGPPPRLNKSGSSAAGGRGHAHRRRRRPSRHSSAGRSPRGSWCRRGR